MTRVIIPAAFVVLAACSVTPPEQEVEAVRDFVTAAALEPLDQIRADRNAGGYTALNDYFVILPSRRKEYLVEFERRCREVREDLNPYGPGFPRNAIGGIDPTVVDVRRDSSILRAKFDTIRGCRIEAFYELTDEQVKELKNLGDAPGEEVFLPESQ